MLKKIQRLGALIANLTIDNFLLEELNMKHYMEKLSEYERSKIVYVVPVTHWYEGDLCNWFIQNHNELGFKKILEEKTPQYEEIKAEMYRFRHREKYHKHKQP